MVISRQGAGETSVCLGGLARSKICSFDDIFLFYLVRWLQKKKKTTNKQRIKASISEKHESPIINEF